MFRRYLATLLTACVGIVGQCTLAKVVITESLIRLVVQQ